MEASLSASATEESVSSSTEGDTAELDTSQPSMFRSLSDALGNVVPWEYAGLGSHEWPKLLDHADSGFETDKALQAVVSILQYLEQSSPATLVNVTEILADGSRKESFRLPFGDNNVLDFYLDLLAKDTDEHDWMSDALRLVGNTCADLEVNRERALAKLKLPTLLRRLAGDKADVALGVLCNLCLDYEPAQAALRANHLFPSIIQLLERRSYNFAYLPQVSLLLDIASEDFNPERYPDSQAIAVIYQTITIPGVDIETQISLANALLTLSKHERIQKTMIADDSLSTILNLFVYSYTQDAGSAKDDSTSTSEPKLQHRALDPEDEAQLTILRSALSARLWDISTLTEFTIKYLPTSVFVHRLISWLSTNEPQMQLCACSILRNVASSDQNATEMVMKFKIHRLLIPFLDNSSNLQLLEELLRLMKNLAVHAANKKELEAFESITLLWARFESPTLQYAAASLVRQLLRGCFGNVHRLLRPNTSVRNVSYAAQLLQFYSNTNDPAIKTEISRTIVEMWRTANSGDSDEIRDQMLCAEKALRETNLGPDGLVKPVIEMIVKSENASLVTEGWFGLALMAGSEQLRGGICNALCGDVVKDVFKATVSSQEAHSKDKENAQILADRLLKDTTGDPTRHGTLRFLMSRSTEASEVEPS